MSCLYLIKIYLNQTFTDLMPLLYVISEKKKIPLKITLKKHSPWLFSAQELWLTFSALVKIMLVPRQNKKCHGLKELQDLTPPTHTKSLSEDSHKEQQNLHSIFIVSFSWKTFLNSFISINIFVGFFSLPFRSNLSWSMLLSLSWFPSYEHINWKHQTRQNHQRRVSNSCKT